jgi:hypothetical protein
MYSKHRLYNIELIEAFESKQSEKLKDDFFDDALLEDKLFIIYI